MKILLPLIFLILVSPAWADDDPAKREAELLAQIRANRGGVSALVELARLRESRGHFAPALATWDRIKKQYGAQKVPSQSSAPTRTYAQTADFMMHRLNRKRNLAARPARANPKLQRQISRWLEKNKFFALEKDGNYDFFAQVDLDGDQIDEVFFAGKYGPTEKRDEPFFGVAQWKNNRYQVVYRAKNNRPIIMPVAFWILDREGDGWKEIALVFEPETENVAYLGFNGQSALMF